MRAFSKWSVQCEVLSEVVLALVLLISCCCFCRCLLDPDLPVVQSDTEPCRYKKKRHSENFGKELDCTHPRPQAVRLWAISGDDRSASCLLTTCPKGLGLFPKKNKQLTVESRVNGCQYGQGKRQFVELREKILSQSCFEMETDTGRCNPKCWEGCVSNAGLMPR